MMTNEISWSCGRKVVFFLFLISFVVVILYNFDNIKFYQKAYINNVSESETRTGCWVWPAPDRPGSLGWPGLVAWAGLAWAEQCRASSHTANFAHYTVGSWWLSARVCC